MPRQGKMLTRCYRAEEELEKPFLDLLGKSTHDIYLNDTAYCRIMVLSVFGGYSEWVKFTSTTLSASPFSPLLIHLS